MNKKRTLSDLAAALNTSSATVSRALQNNPRIGIKMREAVWALAKEWNYTPNPIATQLRTGKGRVIGVIVPRIDRHFFASVIGSIEKAAHAAGYTVIVTQSNESVAQEADIVRILISQKVDGIIASLSVETTSYEHFETTVAHNVPIVFFDRVPVGIPSWSIEIDNRHIAYISTKHLIQQGCKRVAHIGGHLQVSVYQQRLQGYKEALEEAAIPYNEDLVVTNAITIEAGREAALKLLRLPQRIDAIFSAGDYSAIGAINTLQEHGLHIPLDVAVVGMANEIFDTFVSPTLSSVDLQNNTIGQKAAELLIKQMENNAIEQQYEHIVLKSKLIIRESSNKKQ